MTVTFILLLASYHSYALGKILHAALATRARLQRSDGVEALLHTQQRVRLEVQLLREGGGDRGDVQAPGREQHVVRDAEDLVAVGISGVFRVFVRFLASNRVINLSHPPQIEVNTLQVSSSGRGMLSTSRSRQQE